MKKILIFLSFLLFSGCAVSYVVQFDGKKFVNFKETDHYGYKIVKKHPDHERNLDLYTFLSPDGLYVDVFTPNSFSSRYNIGDFVGITYNIPHHTRQID